MPIFRYKAKNQYGEAISGKVEANNEHAAASLLRSRGLLVIQVKLASDSIIGGSSQLFSKVSQTDVVNFTRQLSTMITAGLPLTDGLRILELQSKPAMQKLIGEVIREIENGSNFAASLQKQEKTFSRVYIQLVKAGETGGVLDEVLNRLADNLEKQKEFRSKTQGAMIYPVIVLVAMGIVGAIMMIVVIPKLTAMYEDFGAELPLVTQILIDMSKFFSTFWWLIAAGGVVGGVAFRSWSRTPTGQHAVGRLMLKIPVFGPLRQKMILTEFARTLSLLLSAGVSLLQALEIVTEALENIIYREVLSEVSKKIEKGIAFGQAITVAEEFPPILSQMIAVGEQTGKLDDVLFKLSRYFEAETEQAVKNMTTALEPMIMIVLGLGVGLMVMAIIMPIYNLTSQF